MRCDIENRELGRHRSGREGAFFRPESDVTSQCGLDLRPWTAKSG
jgi:hypothetical protein